MYRWWKFVRPTWLKKYEEAVRVRAGNLLAIIERPYRRRVLIEAAGQTRLQAQHLVHQFGGSIERIRRDRLEQLIHPPKPSQIKIGRRLIIANIAEKSARRQSSRSQILIIPAAGAFGTGEHVTTAMCLRVLEEISRPWPPGWSMLDAGTGSGILALAGRCFGARGVIAIDNDPRAIAIAKSNARLNRIRDVNFAIGDARKLRTRPKFDVIVANLVSELLIEAIPAWKVRLKNPGFFVLSGVLRGQEKQVTRVLRKNKIVIEEICRRGKWIALCGRVARASGLRMI
jgi:ribosomal protein L11 methyltransferase